MGKVVAILQAKLGDPVVAAPGGCMTDAPAFNPSSISIASS